MLQQFESLLETVPRSVGRPGFTGLVIRAVNPSETPVVEYRAGAGTSAGDIASLAREYLHDDSSYEAETYWDLWQYEVESSLWQRRPEALLVVCSGDAYDDGAADE